MMNRSNGYGGGQVARKNPNLPTHIVCDGRCGQVKPSSCYSDKQLEILVNKMRKIPAFDARKMPLIVCTSDTSRQVVELECFQCEESMGLDKFTKAQRKDPDHAECMKCVKERVEMEPHEVGRDYEDDDHHGSDEDTPGGSGDDESEDHGVATSMAELSVSGNASTYPSQNGASTGGGHGGVSVMGSNAPTSRQNTSTKAPSVAGTTSTARTARTHGVSTNSTRAGGAWGKPSAGPQKPATKVVSNDENDEDKIVASACDSD